MITNQSDSFLGQRAKVGAVFESLNRKFEEQETQRRARELKLPYFDLSGIGIDQAALSLVAQDEAERAEAIIFFKEGPSLKIGIVDPQNPALQSMLATLTQKKYQTEFYLVSRSAFASAFQQYKKILKVSSASRHEIEVMTGPSVLHDLRVLPQNAERLKRLTPTELLNLIIGGAVTMKASDIHLEPEKIAIKIRFRVDGVLQDAVTLPRSVEHILSSRIKLLSNLKLNVTGVPQDGRFAVKLSDRMLDLRVSSLPSAFGESIVIRILGIQEMGLEIEKLGLRGRAMEVVYHELKKPNGMMLTTGPTGSGKTTTLYAFLSSLNKPGVKIVTLEDPVEYQLSGIIQTPIDHSAGMDFAKGLRSILRQDPDIVMVGEIRDFETAETAAQAALTGHVVLSTLHTNDAAGAIPRMLDFGVKPVTLAPALNVLIAQRLLRKLCPDCREAYRPTPEELRRVRSALAQIPPAAKVQVPERLIFSHGRGCEACHNLGYRGRLGVFEVLQIDETIERLIFSLTSASEIKKAAAVQGMLTMNQDAILKALEGVTDLAEVWRVTEE